MVGHTSVSFLFPINHLLLYNDQPLSIYKVIQWIGDKDSEGYHSSPTFRRCSIYLTPKESINVILR